MGYVFPASSVAALKDIDSPDAVTRNKARETVAEGRQSYQEYVASMRRGLFGLLIGRALYRRPRRFP